MNFLEAIVNNPRTERFVILLIVLNAITLGLETSISIMAEYGTVLHVLDTIFLWIFVAELVARFIVRRSGFFRDPWNVFDAIVIGIALVPASGAMSVLRSLRVLRLMRLVTAIPSLKRVVGGLIGAIPGMGSITLLMVLIYYVFAVMGTKLFGASAPEQFGSLGATAYTLFQIMTFDDWSGGVAKPLMEKHSYAIVYIVVFILLSAFMMLNLFIGVVVSALDDERDATAPKLLHDPQDMKNVLAELQAIRAELARLQEKA
ncbi:Ion transport domain containing protein [Rhabdaerophilaceae bacterium]